jgi:hypothetical protein
MGFEFLDEAAGLLDKANANLEPELLSTAAAREALAGYARIKKLAAYGETVLARKVDDAHELARVTGTSIGRAKETVDTARRLRDSDEVAAALQAGEVSLEQAAEIAKAEESRPGSASELLAVAGAEPFHVLKDRARRLRLDAEQNRDLASRQHAARCARSHRDELG